MNLSTLLNTLAKLRESDFFRERWARINQGFEILIIPTEETYRQQAIAPVF